MWKTKLQKVSKEPIQSSSLNRQIQDSASNFETPDAAQFDCQIGNYKKFCLASSFHPSPSSIPQYDISQHISQFSFKLQQMYKLNELRQRLAKNPQVLLDTVIGHYDPVLFDQQQQIFQQWQREAQLQSDLVMQYIMIDKLIEQNLFNQFYHSIQLLHLTRQNEILKREAFQSTVQPPQSILDGYEMLCNLKKQFEIDCDFKLDEKVFVQKVHSKTQLIIEKLLQNTKYIGKVLDNFEPLDSCVTDFEQRQLAMQMALQGRYNQLYQQSNKYEVDGIITIDLDNFRIGIPKIQHECCDFQQLQGCLDVSAAINQIDQGIQFIFGDSLQNSCFLDILDNTNKNNLFFFPSGNVDYFDESLLSPKLKDNFIYLPFNEVTNSKYGVLQFSVAQEKVDFIIQRLIQGPDIRKPNQLFDNVKNIGDSNLFIDYIFFSIVFQIQCLDTQFLQKQCRQRNQDNLNFCLEVLSVTKLMMLYQDMVFNLNTIFYFIQKAKSDFKNISFDFTVDLGRNQFVKDQDGHRIIFKQVFDELIFIIHQILGRFRKYYKEVIQNDPDHNKALILQQIQLLFTEENNRLQCIKDLLHQMFIIFYRSTEFHNTLLYLMIIFVRQRQWKVLQLDQFKNLIIELQLAQQKDFKIQTRSKLKTYEKMPQFRDIIDNSIVDHSIITKTIIQIFQSTKNLEFKTKNQNLLGSFIESSRIQLIYLSKLRSLQSGQDISIQLNQDFNLKLFENTIGTGALSCEQSRQFLTLQDLFYRIIQKMQNFQELGCIRMMFKPIILQLDENLMNSSSGTEDKALLDKLLKSTDSELNLNIYTQLDCFKEYGNSDFLQTLDQYDYQVSNNLGISFVFDLLNAVNQQLVIYVDDLGKVNRLLKFVDLYLEKLQMFNYQKICYYDQLAFTDYNLANIKIEKQTFLSINRNQDHMKDLEQIYENFIPLSQKAFLTQAAQKSDNSGQNNTPTVIISLINLLAEYQVMWKQQLYGKLRQNILPFLQQCQERCEGTFDKLIQPQYFEFGMENYNQIFSIVLDSDLSKHFDAIIDQLYQRNQLFRLIDETKNRQNQFDLNMQQSNDDLMNNQLLLSQACGNDQIAHFESATLYKFEHGDQLFDKNGHLCIASQLSIHQLSFASVKPSSLILSVMFDWYTIINNIFDYVHRCVQFKLLQSAAELNFIDDSLLNQLETVKSQNNQVLKKQVDQSIILDRSYNNKLALQMLKLIANNEDIRIDTELNENIIISYLLEQIYQLQQYLNCDKKFVFNLQELTDIDALCIYSILKLIEFKLYRILQNNQCLHRFESFQNNEFNFCRYQYIPPTTDIQTLAACLFNIQPRYRSLHVFSFDFALGNSVSLQIFEHHLTSQQDFAEKEIIVLANKLQKLEIITGKDDSGRNISYQNMMCLIYQEIITRIRMESIQISELLMHLYLREQNIVCSFKSSVEDQLKNHILIKRKNFLDIRFSKQVLFETQEMKTNRLYPQPLSFDIIIPGCFGFVDINKVKELEEKQQDDQSFSFMNIQPLRTLYQRILRSSSRTAYQDIGLLTPFTFASLLQQFSVDVYQYLKNSIYYIQDYETYGNQYELSHYSSKTQLSTRSMDFQIGCYYLQFKMQSKMIQLERKLIYQQNTQQTFVNLIVSQTLQNLQNKHSQLFLINQNIQQYLPQSAIIFQNMLKKLYIDSIHSLQTTQLIIQQQNIESKEDFLEHANNQLLSKRLFALQKLFKNSGQQIFNELYHYEIELSKLQQNLLIEAKLLRRGIGFSHLRLSELQHEIQSITDLQHSEENRLKILQNSIIDTNCRKEDKMRQSITNLTSQLAGIVQELNVLNEQLRTLAPNLHKAKKDEQMLEKATNLQLQPLSALADAIAIPQKLQIDVEFINGKLRQVEIDYVAKEQQYDQLRKEFSQIFTKNQQQTELLQTKLELSRNRRIEMVKSVGQLEQAQQQMEAAKMQKLDNFDLQLNDQITILQGEMNRERMVVRKLDNQMKEMHNLVKEFECETGKRLTNLFV